MLIRYGSMLTKVHMLVCLLGKFCFVHSHSFMGTDACQYASDWLREDVPFGGV